MKFVSKLQKLPDNKKNIILWSIIIVVGLSFSIWRINVFISEIEVIRDSSFKDQTGIEIIKKETGNEIGEGLEIIRESTKEIKEGAILIREIFEEIRKMEEINFDESFEIPIEKNN